MDFGGSIAGPTAAQGADGTGATPPENIMEFLAHRKQPGLLIIATSAISLALVGMASPARAADPDSTVHLSMPAPDTGRALRGWAVNGGYFGDMLLHPGFFVGAERDLKMWK